jgi:hypothetical protein
MDAERARRGCCSEHGGWRTPGFEGPDYDEEPAESIFDALQFLPPWSERDLWGDKIGERLPASPRTGGPCPADRAWFEWRECLAGGGFWSFEEEAAARAKTANLRGVRDVALARQRAGLAKLREDAELLGGWMRRHAGEVGERAREAFELVYLQGRTLAAAGAEMGITPEGVERHLTNLRRSAGLPPTPAPSARRRLEPRRTPRLGASAARQAAVAPRLQRGRTGRLAIERR